MLNITALFNTNYYITILLAVVAVAGDILVSHSKVPLYKAVTDNVIHAVIGGLSWFLVCLNYRNKNSAQTLLEIIVCTAVSSLIDLDHFVAAKSLNLKDAVNLKNRPALHCSTFPLVFSVTLFFIGYHNRINALIRTSLIVFVGFASHHTRDSTRRGYWLYPFGSTPPIPYYLYLSLTCSIPYFACWILKRVHLDKYTQVPIVI